MLSARETGAESDPSDLRDKSTESTDSDRPKPSWSPSCNVSERLSLCSESAPKNDDFRVCSNCGSSEPALPRIPLFSRDLLSTLSESLPEFHDKQDSAPSFPLVRGGSASQSFGVTTSTPEGPTEPFVAEPPTGSDRSRDAHLLRSFSHESDSLESDSATAPVSDLYISESETRDFILSAHVDPREFQCLEYQPGGKTDGDTRVPMCDSDSAASQCHRSSSEERATADRESDVSRHAGPPAADAREGGWMLVNDGSRGNAEPIDLTPRPQRSHSPVELWLDACQYLAGEETDDWRVLDRTRYVTQGGLTSELSFPPGETRVSGYNLDGSDGIGWSGDDTIGWGPPVERWSSVDSWASALSDWTGIIAAPPEDFTAAFTEIGAEIDALTQALAEVKTHLGAEAPREGTGQEAAVRVQSQPPMGVQNQNLPGSTVLSGQRCPFLCLEAAGPEFRGREGSQSVESLCDSTAQEKKELEEIQSCTHQQSSPGSSGGTAASPGGRGGGAIPGSTSSADPNPSPWEGCVQSDLFFSSDGDQIVLNISEETDVEGHDTPGDLRIEMSFGDEVCEVTDERRVSRLRSLTESKGVQRSPAEVDREGPDPPTELRVQATHALTDSHVPVVHKQAGSHTDVRAHVPSDPLPDLDGARQVEPPSGSLEFIMPSAPLGNSAISSLICRTSRSLEGDKKCARRSLNDKRELGSDHTHTGTLWPTVEGVTDSKSSEGDELTRKKGNTRKPAEKSSPEGQVNLISVRKKPIKEIHDLSRELSASADAPADRVIASERKRVAFITLDLKDPFVSRAAKPVAAGAQAELNPKTAEKMPHKTNKSTWESKARSKKEKTCVHHHGAQACKKQESFPHHGPAQQVCCKQQDAHPLTGDNHGGESAQVGLVDKEAKLAIETGAATEKAPGKPHGKKKKKHAPNATGAKGVAEPLVEVENGAKAKTAKGRIDMFEAKLGAKAGKAQKDSDQSEERKSQKPEGKAKASQGEPPKDRQPKNFPGPSNDDIIKRRRLSVDKFGKSVGVSESKLAKPDACVHAKGEEPKVDATAGRKKAHSDVVKPKTPKEEPKALQPIQVGVDSGDPQSLRLWCQFAAVSSQHTVTWSRGGAVLSESNGSAGDEGRASLSVSKASHKDVGKYQCQLTSLHGSLTLDYLLTYEVLSEIVIPPPPKTIAPAPVEEGSEEEDVHCSKLIFKEDFLSQQHFGENQAASIVTEKVHFGEGMHRRAFRTKMQAGQILLVLPGHSCVLKVHTSISYGTKSSDELIQKNFSLAVEECHVQNTAREYIKGYTAAAQSVEAFGEIPEIIPIYLVHRPSNDVPYATLEEELIGDFVKYSVKDGKEINLMRRDSEAGQKCCAFQHWVYHKTEGNLLVTDMQGVGMRLTDVGIATCKKGYKGFKGNCAASFIEQFKALHQCNVYCEFLGLKSLQPKPKKPASAPKPKPQPSAAAKKKTFGPTVKGKS